MDRFNLYLAGKQLWKKQADNSTAENGWMFTCKIRKMRQSMREATQNKIFSVLS